MPNPYYIDTGRSGLHHMADLAVRLKGMKESSRLTEKEQALKSREMDTLYGKEGSGEQGEYGRRTAVQEDQVSVGEERNRLLGKQQEMETPEHLKSFGPEKGAQARMMFGTIDMQLGEKAGKGVASKAFQPVINFVDSLAQNEAVENREMAYDLTKQAWPALKGKVIKSLTDSALSLQEKDPQKSDAIMQMITEIGEEKNGSLVDQVFKQTRKSLAAQELAAVKSEQKYADTKEGFLATEEGKNKRAQLKRDTATKPKEPNETEKQIDFKLASGLRKITHDKEGMPVKKIPRSLVEGLNKTAKSYGREVVKIDLPKIEKRGPFNDLKPLSLYAVVKQGEETISPETLIDILVSEHGMDEDDAKLYLKALGIE